jgi:hypothetical protein
MADDVSFTISASDQASKVVETVQKKIQNFGSDVAKMALGFAGPMALLQAGIGYVTDKWNEYKQAQTDAFEKGAGYTYNEIKAQGDLGDKLDKNLSIMLAMAKAEEERAKNTKERIEQENQAIARFLETDAGKKFKEENSFVVGVFGTKGYSGNREKELKAVKEYTAELQKQIAAENEQVNDPIMTEQELKLFREMLEIRKELDKRGGKSLAEINAIEIFTKNFKEQSAMPKQKTKDAVKDDLKLTVSSLREIGGSFGGGDVSTGIEKQITLAEKQLDTLTEIKDALNRGTTSPMVIDTPLGELLTGETGKFIG